MSVCEREKDKMCGGGGGDTVVATDLNELMPSLTHITLSM